MPRTAHKRAVRRKIEREGKDVTLQNYTNSGDTVDGENWTPDSTQTIKAIEDRSGSGLGFDRDDRSTDTQSRKIFHVKDTVTGIRDGGGSGASEITTNSVDYIVMQQDDLGNGSYRLICWRRE